MERTLALIKPDGVEKNIIGKVISCYEEAGLKVVGLKMVKISEEFAAAHYSDHKGKKFYDELITFITRGPLCVLVLEGEDAVEKVRKTNGATNPAEADKDTIRGRYGIDKTQNCVHASDSVENAEHEIVHWFPNEVNVF